MKYITVPGTWSWPKDWNVVAPEEWWRFGSDHNKFLTEQGFSLYRPDTSFIWNSEVDGERFFERFEKEPNSGYKDHHAWISGAIALAFFVQGGVEAKDTNIICHSHGLQVVLYACYRFNLKINNLLSVCSPIRHDMVDVTEAAIKNIKFWVQVQDTEEDEWQRRGRFGDGAIQIHRPRSKANVEVNIDGIDHSKILYDKNYYHHWIDEGLIDYLRLNNG